MDPATAIDRILAGDDRAVFREMQGVKGFSAAYFARLHAAFATNPAAAAVLAGKWRMLLRYGDDPALAYRAKAVADRVAGRWLASANSFEKAAVLAHGLERLTYPIGAIDSYARAGRVGDATMLGKRLIRSLTKVGAQGHAARAALNLGNALLWADRYREGAKWLEHAVHNLDSSGEKVFAMLGLSTAELFGGSPTVAEARSREAAREAERLGMAHAASLARLNEAQAKLMQGRADETLQELLAIRSDLVDAPTEHARLAEFLGDAYLRLNLYPEAADAYGEALSLPLGPLDRAATQLGLGQALFLDGRIAECAAPLKRAQRAFSRAENIPWAASAETWLAKAAVSSRQALRLAVRAAEQARAANSPWHETEALLTLAETSTDAPAAAVRRAGHLIARHGFRSVAWRIPARKSKLEPTLANHRKTFAAILESRLLTRSIASRAAYLRDKHEHISAYLAFLLEKPTPNRVREALDVVTRSRSVALVDELAGRGALSDEQVAQLDALRAELHASESEAQRDGGARRGVSNQRLAALQRRWIQTSHRLVDFSSVPDLSSATTVLARADSALFALKGDRATKLGLSAPELTKTLGWLQFELLAPMVDRAADPAPALAVLERLACAMVAPWIGGDQETTAICPSDQMWQVPWTTCVSMITGRETVLALHPSFARASNIALNASSSAVLWLDRASDLPKADEEAEAFLARFPNAVVCESAAEVRASLGRQMDVLHVICHANHNSRNPLFSSLQFGKESIFAVEIAQSSISPRIVTLSACETANVSVSVRDEPDGLARAFLACGAESVIGSLWPLDDEAAALMFTELYTMMTSGATILESLGAARMKVRAWNPHPYFWASTVLFGGYEG